MNKITKRIVASLSAAALIVSTFGSNSFSGAAMDSVYAEESATTTSNRKGKSTGFNNLEQDTNAAGEYNTGYGLHTNKTASVADGSTDGRTFDVNLESWYVGENPVDIATILDASGSMAWTMNTLEPLEIDENEVKELREIQEKNGGYLPEEKVEELLKPDNTDNTKLSYSDYLYYVYEARSTVSEFVPLGFWDGGENPLDDENLIGYYPFDGTLKNKAPKAAENTDGKVISLPATDSDISTDVLTEPATAVFKNSALDIQQTASKGGVMLDKVPTKKQFTIQIDIGNNKATSSDNNVYGSTSILYMTDGTHFLKIFRPGGSSRNRLRIQSESKYNGENYILNANTVFNNNGIEANTWTFNFDLDNNKLDINVKNEVDLKDDKTKSKSISKTEISGFNEWDLSKLQIIVGGATEKIEEEYSEVFVKNLVIKENDTEIANYPLTKDLNNTTTASSSAFMVKQPYTDGAFDTTPLDGVAVEAVYAEGGLDINATAGKKAAVLLGAVPNLSSEKGFTLSFKLQKSNSLKTDKQNLFYLGDKNETDYYQFFRSSTNGGYLVLSKDQEDKLNDNELYYQGGLVGNGIWYTNTLVFEPSDDNQWKVTPYVDGLPAQKKDGQEGFLNGKDESGKDRIGDYNVPESIDSFTISKDELVLLLGALQSNSSGSNHYIDDFYVFNTALSAEKVNLYFNVAPCNVANSSHARSIMDGKVVDIAQISNSANRLAQNSDIDERRGWYYVNSHSSWEDITGCLESGKQYIGIKKESTDEKKAEGEKYYVHESIATIPNAWYSEDADGNKIPNASYDKLFNNIINGNDEEFKYDPPETERSIRFFVDNVGYLRCFVWTGSNSKDNDPRTFCSVVYCNGNDKENRSSVTKYEQLNGALNSFFEKLAENSDLTNSAVVRFSTINAVVEDDEKTTNENLKKLTMKDWTNWSDYYQETMKNHGTPSEDNYLHDLLIPETGETSLGIDNSATTSGEYPYVMTGGTYTWTGLKAFYDNMIVGNSDDADPTNYNISIDARDKYLIIFTDGRDNTQDYELGEDGPVADSGSVYKKSDYVNDYKPEKSSASKDGELAEAWADEIKASGYTIFCVMMATGSISPTANEAEYNKAYYFLSTLAGSNKENKETLDEAIDKFIKAYNDKRNEVDSKLENLTKDTWYDAEVDEKGWGPDVYNLYLEAKNLQDYMDSHVLIAEPGKTNTTEEAFRKILEQIQQPRADYTVQDYIDPRFNLIDKNGVLYKLGPNGNITYGTTTTQVGDIIDNPDAKGLPFTTRNAEYVNVKSVTTNSDGTRTYNNPDENGTGYIYYDDDKDMYYLRWTDQIIPMRNSSLDTNTASGNPEYLDVWSATIRLKAKDDFIGGNDILTNGNEAGENLVFSEATIKNMDAYPDLYNFTPEQSLDKKYTEREKLQVLSGTDRKINAVDAGGVSQAVYGKGMDIPSSGFPRVTVNVRLLPLNSKNLNDVIYMGEVVSPTMMLADLENDYMTGSYYLEYLERYAYRLYGNDAGETPLIELLNQWLRINEDDVEAKTFTIPYIYLPDPVYKTDGTLDTVTSGGAAKVENSSGLDSADAGTPDAFSDLNLRDVTGFITYTWKRDDGSKEEQQKMETTTPSGEPQYDITREYVVKNTNQIKYNLQLKFTPLKTEELKGFVLDGNFIQDREQFFNVRDLEFNGTGVDKWTFTNRSEYLKAMVSETHIYEPHIIYDSGSEKWVLVGTETGAIEGAKQAYVDADLDHQTEKIPDINKVKDTGVYDWNIDYKETAGNSQLEYDKWKSDSGYYGNAKIESFEKGGTSVENCTLSANTIYIKDVVNGALALELVVDGKYLKGESPKIHKGKTYTFLAQRYYDDLYDPLPYGTQDSMHADTGEGSIAGDGQQYRLTFEVDKDGSPKSIPDAPQDGEFYTVWAKLIKVEVEDSTASGGYQSITKSGYENEDSLPIGTYEIEVNDTEMKTEDGQYHIGGTGDAAKYFTYLKIDNAHTSFTYNRFPENVYTVSETAKESTKDGEYLIWDNSTDYASENIAKNDRDRIKDGVSDSQTLTFYFGTVKERTINGKDLSNTIGYNRNDKSDPAVGNDYAKDRLGIILLSADLNNLFISKEVTHTNNSDDKARSWEFIVTFTPNNDTESKEEFVESNEKGFSLKWYKRNNSDSTWEEKTDLETGYPDSVGGTTEEYPLTIKFGDPDVDGKYTAKIYLKHNEKVLIDNLPDGTWQVTETDERDEILYSSHNDKDDVDEYSWSNKTDEQASLPGAGVQFTNQFPFYILSAGGSGTYLYILCGGLLLFMASVLYYLSRLRKSKSRDKPDG